MSSNRAATVQLQLVNLTTHGSSTPKATELGLGVKERFSDVNSERISFPNISVTIRLTLDFDSQPRSQLNSVQMKWNSESWFTKLGTTYCPRYENLLKGCKMLNNNIVHTWRHNKTPTDLLAGRQDAETENVHGYHSHGPDRGFLSTSVRSRGELQLYILLILLKSSSLLAEFWLKFPDLRGIHECRSIFF